MTTAQIGVQSLLDFINHDLLLGRSLAEPITEHSNLITAGIIDSLSLIQLVTHLEKETKIEIADQDVNPDNFQTVSTIVNYLKNRQEQ